MVNYGALRGAEPLPDHTAKVIKLYVAMCSAVNLAIILDQVMIRKGKPNACAERKPVHMCMDKSQ